MGKNGIVISESTFKANAVKPVIIIDITGKKFEGEETKNSPFIVVDDVFK